VRVAGRRRHGGTAARRCGRRTAPTRRPHGAHTARLDPLIAARLASPEGRHLDGAFRATPYGIRLRDVPEIEDAGLRDLLTEVVVHALVYQGALREAGGLPPLDGYWRQVAASASGVRARRAVAGGVGLVPSLGRVTETQSQLDVGRHPPGAPAGAGAEVGRRSGCPRVRPRRRERRR
jgi:hypothetical protein